MKLSNMTKLGGLKEAKDRAMNISLMLRKRALKHLPEHMRIETDYEN